MTEQIDAFLAHYGVKGMRWGVRRERDARSVDVKARPGRKVKASGGQHHAPHEDAIKVAVSRQKARKSSTDALSTKDLQEMVTRMNLEQQYARLKPDPTGLKVARGILNNTGDHTIDAIGKGVTAGTGNPVAGKATRIGLHLAKSAVGSGNNGGGSKKKKK